MAWSTALVLGAGLVAGTSGAGSAAATSGGGGIDPASFRHPVANRYFPLRPGTLSVLRGSNDGVALEQQVRVTRRTKVIEGVRATVIDDSLHRADGSIAEQTVDWYAADDRGNVWYLGEQTATYDERGNVLSRDGSWLAGRDGATAGIIMPADPRPTLAYRQELRRGHAEDQAWIVQNDATTTVPYGNLNKVVRSFEWTRLEPDVVSVKLYAPGLGVVHEGDVAGGTESFDLVSVSSR